MQVASFSSAPELAREPVTDCLELGGGGGTRIPIHPDDEAEDL